MKNKSGFIVMIVLALLILSPIDAIPDFIPLAGFLDDILYGLGIAVGVLKMISERQAYSEPEEVKDAQQWDNYRQ